MFENSFKQQLAFITNDKILVEGLWQELASHYAEPHRHYHQLSHLDKLESCFLEVHHLINDWQTIIFSIAYHDVIYDPLKSDNEERSADYAEQQLSKLSVPGVQRQKCRSQIMATKRHEKSADSDTNFLTDADLAILGANDEEYYRYAKMVRKEFISYPDLLFKIGRQKVIKHFLEMPRIYKTDHFYELFEEKARRNLSAELKNASWLE